MLIPKSLLVQLVGMLNNHLTDNKLTTLLKASLTSVLDNQTTLINSLFILIKGTSNLLKVIKDLKCKELPAKVIKDLKCKELLDKVSSIINISNNQIKFD